MLIYCIINIDTARPAETTTTPPLGWCHHTHTQFSTNNFISILYSNAYFKYFI